LRLRQREVIIMKMILISVLTFVLSVVFGNVAGAEIAKEGTFSGTEVYSGTYKVMPLEKVTYVITFEHTGVLTSDTGEGPFHNMSVHCVGFHYYEKEIAKSQWVTWFIWTQMVTKCSLSLRSLNTLAQLK
jgi:hypothetical protein